MLDKLLAWGALNHAASDESSSVDDVREAIAEVNKARARKVAKRYTRGDVQIQRGEYVTAEDIDRILGRAPWRS